jgi:hypothetical protein
MAESRKQDVVGFLNPIPPQLRKIRGYQEPVLCVIFKKEDQVTVKYFKDT